MTSSMREGFLRDDATGALVISGGGMPDASGQPDGKILTVTGGLAGWSDPTVTTADIAILTSLLATGVRGEQDRNVDGTWGPRKTGFKSIRWIGPGVDTGVWLATHAYNADDVVSNGGNLYQAKISFTSGASFVGTNWNQIPAAALDELLLTT